MQFSNIYTRDWTVSDDPRIGSHLKKHMNCQKQIVVVRLVSSLVLFTLLVGIHNFSNYSYLNLNFTKLCQRICMYLICDNCF
jgi:hypothetical protein